MKTITPRMHLPSPTPAPLRAGSSSPLSSDDLDAIAEFLRIAATSLRELADHHDAVLPGSPLVERTRQYADRATELSQRLEER